jgi:hypothetical protein
VRRLWIVSSTGRRLRSFTASSFQLSSSSVSSLRRLADGPGFPLEIWPSTWVSQTRRQKSETADKCVNATYVSLKGRLFTWLDLPVATCTYASLGSFRLYANKELRLRVEHHLFTNGAARDVISSASYHALGYDSRLTVLELIFCRLELLMKHFRSAGNSIINSLLRSWCRREECELVKIPLSLLQLTTQLGLFGLQLPFTEFD